MHQGRCAYGANQAKSDAQHSQPSGFAQHQLTDGVASCAQSHADTYLPGALAYGVCDDAVHAGNAEEEREHGESADKPCCGAMHVSCGSDAYALFHADGVGGAQTRVDALDSAYQSGKHRTL